MVRTQSWVHNPRPWDRFLEAHWGTPTILGQAPWSGSLRPPCRCVCPTEQSVPEVTHSGNHTTAPCTSKPPPRSTEAAACGPVPLAARAGPSPLSYPAFLGGPPAWRHHPGCYKGASAHPLACSGILALGGLRGKPLKLIWGIPASSHTEKGHVSA